MKRILVMIMMSVGLAAVSAVAAAPFGVSGEKTSQSAMINRLLNRSSAKISAPTTQPTVMSEKEQTAQAQQAQRTLNQLHTAEDYKGFGASPVNQEAFTHMVHNMMPLSPEQIRTLHYLFSKSQQAASEYPGTPPKPTSSAVMVDLSPGATPPIIRLRAGYVTSLVFLDATGQPWPITAYDVGDPKSFNIQPNVPTGKSDTMLVQALVTYKPGNLAVMLKGMHTPIMITLMPGQQAVDYRVDLRVPGMGPNAQPYVNGLPATANPQLITFLNGVPPMGSKALRVVGAPARAWLSGGQLFLRTRLTVLSPSWVGTMSSPDGMHVYELMKTPVVLASQRGKIIKLKIKGL